MHFGIISSPVPGHINPLCAVGRGLITRGHTVTFLSIPDTRAKIVSEKIPFYPIGESDYPEGTFLKQWGPLMHKRGITVVLKTIVLHTQIAEMMCREVPLAVKKLGITVLLIDQIQYQGSAIAKVSGCPFITISCALHVYRSTGKQIPTPFVPYRNSSKSLSVHLRNKLSWIFFDLLSSLILNTGRTILKQSGFKAVKNIEDSFSSIAQIIPMPAQFDWPIVFRDAKRVHYIGSLVDSHNSGGSFDLPPNNIKPVVYVSLGTLQNENYKLLKRIDSGLASMNVFPIIALGKWVPASGKIPFTLNATVLDYAPQKQILAKASLCITHGGINTAIESLTFGVPLLVIPITNDQPGVAQRVVSTGVGLSLNMQNITIKKIQSAVQNILDSESIKNAALQMKSAIAEAGGCERAVDIIEKAIGHF